MDQRTLLNSCKTAQFSGRPAPLYVYPLEQGGPVTLPVAFFVTHTHYKWQLTSYFECVCSSN